MDKEQIQSHLRKLLTVAGTWLAAKGLPFIDSEVAGWISGLIMFGVSTWLSSRSAKQKTVLKEAVAGDIPMESPEVKAIVPLPAPDIAPEPSPSTR